MNSYRKRSSINLNSPRGSKLPTCMMFGKTALFFAKMDEAEQKGISVVDMKGKDKPRRVYIPPPKKIKPHVKPFEPEVQEEVYGMKARSKYIQNLNQVTTITEENEDVPTIKKKIQQETEAKMKQKHGDKWRDSDNPEPLERPQMKKIVPRRKYEDPVKEEEANPPDEIQLHLIREYYKKVIDEKLEAMKEPELLLPKLKNNESHNRIKHAHHVAITAPKLTLPGTVAQMYEQNAPVTGFTSPSYGASPFETKRFSHGFPMQRTFSVTNYGTTTSGFKKPTVVLPSLEDNTTIAIEEMQRSTQEAFYSPKQKKALNRNVMFGTATTFHQDGNGRSTQLQSHSGEQDDIERINQLMAGKNQDSTETLNINSGRIRIEDDLIRRQEFEQSMAKNQSFGARLGVPKISDQEMQEYLVHAMDQGVQNEVDGQAPDIAGARIAKLMNNIQGTYKQVQTNPKQVAADFRNRKPSSLLRKYPEQEGLNSPQQTKFRGSKSKGPVQGSQSQYQSKDTLYAQDAHINTGVSGIMKQKTGTLEFNQGSNSDLRADNSSKQFHLQFQN